MWLIYLFWINFIFSSNDIGAPIEATEDPKMLHSLEQFIIEFSQEQKETMHASVTERRSLFANPFAGAPKRIQTMCNQDAMKFMNYAAASYCPQNTLQDWSCKNCNGYGVNTTDVVYFKNSRLETAAFLGVNRVHKHIVISYRGSDNLNNWLTNLQLNLVPFKTSCGNIVKVHNGFNKVVDGFMNSIGSKLKEAIMKYGDFRVVFTGHSLGGALATLSAVKLADKGVVEWSKIQLITFGQPRVGGRSFADFWDSKPIQSARVTTRGDLISIVPIKYLVTPYWHHDYNNHMDFDGTPISCSSPSEHFKCITYPVNRDAHHVFDNQHLNSYC